jgi:hypothetical protein
LQTEILVSFCKCLWLDVMDSCSINRYVFRNKCSVNYCLCVYYVNRDIYRCLCVRKNNGLFVPAAQSLQAMKKGMVIKTKITVNDIEWLGLMSKFV